MTTLVVLALLGSLALGSGSHEVAAASGARLNVAPGRCRALQARAPLPSARALAQMDRFLGSLGARPTGSLAQSRYIAWILARLHRIAGIRVSRLDFEIERWTQRRAVLRLRAAGRVIGLPVADAVPYSRATGAAGVSAPLVAIPDTEPITAANSHGRIVVRPAPAGSILQAAFRLPIVGWEEYDPHHTIDPAASFFGDFINYNSRVADLRAAATAGAAGILFVKDLPRRQIIGHYEPYEGIAWRLPGVFLGADEGARIARAIATDPRASAQIVVTATQRRVTTPTIVATLPGVRRQRIVIDSHTDGTNAVEDNGPIAMVAMARYLAAVPASCRPRTVQFVFSTAHFYQRVGRDRSIRDGGAEQFAQRLDAAYDRGSVSVVLALEHLGAIDYEAVARTDRPGQVLRRTRLPAIQFIGVTPSPKLVAAVDQVVRKYRLQRTILLRGSDAPGPTVPAHCSFGGEGTPYERHLLPTVGVIAAPQTLYDPAFGGEGIDFRVMRAELLAYTRLVEQLQPRSQADIAGSVPAERRQRAMGAPGCPPEN